MTLEISNNRRKEIKNIVLSTLQHSNQGSLPVKIGAIIRSFSNIKLTTYSSQIKKFGITYNEMIISAETKDSYVVRCGSKNKYCIYYNDIDKSIVESNRVRWNLAHELGHILLEHHKLCKTEKIYRNDIFLNNIDKENYIIAEMEANYFAQLILVPHAALRGFAIKNASHIKYLCKISGQASERRFREYIIWKDVIDKRSKQEQEEYDKRIFHYYFNFIYKRKCKNCGVGIVQRYGKYCPICGNKNTLEWGDGDIMKYLLLPTYDNGKLKQCPICENEETDIDGNYCQICSSMLINRCQDLNCPNGNILPSNARFCPICGTPSSFFLNNILKPWNYREVTNSMSIPDGYLNIPDGFDEELPFN